MSFVTLRSFLERMNMTLAEYEWMRNQLDEPKKLKKKRRMLDRVQEDSFDPYKEIAITVGTIRKQKICIIWF